LSALLTAANRLEARQRMESIADMQVGAGVMKRGAALAHLRRLKRQSGYKRERKVPTAADLRAFGFEVVKNG